MLPIAAGWKWSNEYHNQFEVRSKCISLIITSQHCELLSIAYQSTSPYSGVALMAHFTAILTICLHYGDAISRVQDDKSNFSIRWKTTPTFYCKDKVKVSFLKHDFVVWKKLWYMIIVILYYKCTCIIWFLAFLWEKVAGTSVLVSSWLVSVKF